LGGVGVEHIGQRHHAALAHQELDDVDGALRHAARQLLDRDRFRQDDFTRDFFFLIVGSVALEPLRASTERGDRARALVLTRSRAGDSEPAAIALLASARWTRCRDDDLLSRRKRERWAPDHDAPRLVVLAEGSGGAWDSGRASNGCRRDDARRALWGARNGRRRRRLAAGKAPSRFVLRLPLEIGFLGAAQLLFALARFRSLALDALARLALTSGPGLGLLAAAILLLLHARVIQRTSPRLALLVR
jgi:hypothetical protein